jgi:hypothetical protein
MSGEIRGAATPVLERFSYRVNMSNPAPGAAGDNAQFSDVGADDVTADAIAFHSNPAAFIGTYAVLTEVKFASIGIDGKYTGDPFIRAVNQPGNGGGAFRYPPQVSLAVSLMTARRGPRGKGRFFLPCPVVQLGTDLRMSEADRDSIQGAVAGFISNLNNWPGIDAGEPKVTVASTFGTNSDVIAVRVGRALDTIRSRRSDLVEAYNLGTPV